MRWTQDPIAESHLIAVGVPFEYVTDIPIAQIDLTSSKRNNARLDKQYDEDLVTDYGVAMLDGATFPAPLLRRRKDGRFEYFIVSGNHRIGAAVGCGDATINAYILGGDDEMAFDVILRTANRWMGERQTRQEAVEHAKYMIAKYKRSQGEMAKLFGLKPAWLTSALRVDRVRADLVKQGVDASEMSQQSLLQIGQLDDNESAFRKAGGLATQFKLSSERVKEMVASVKMQKSEQSRTDVLKSLEAQLLQERAPKNVVEMSPISKRPDRKRLIQKLNGLTRLLRTGNNGQPYTTLQQIGFTSAKDQKDLHELSRGIRIAFEELFRLANAGQHPGGGIGGRPIQSKHRKGKSR